MAPADSEGLSGDDAAHYRRAGWWTGQRLVDRFESHVAASPDDPAVVSARDTLSRADLWNAAGEAAEQIRAAVGDTGRVVVVHLPNTTPWMVMFLAVLRAGHVPATPPVTTEAGHLIHIFELVRPALAISVSRHRRAAPAEAIREAAARTGGVAVGLADGTALDLHSTGIGREGTGRVPGATAHLMFTSSTTGPPKAVSHSEDSLATLNRQFAQRFGLSARTPVFMPSPLGHSVGAIHGARLSMFLGAPLILQDRWDAATALELVSRHRAAFTAAATPFLLDLANAPWRGAEPKLAPLRSFLCGGAQVPPALIRRCRSEFPNTFVTPLWGMTEGGLTTCVDSSTDQQVETTVGIGLPGLELRVLDSETGMQDSGAGELVMRGPGVFNGYFGQPELYAEHLVGDGFFRTGDLARIDADGYVSITGRVKDLIIRGAVNISPVAIENTIAAHPDVTGVAVIGWPDERLGERICAVVQSTAPLDLDQVAAFCADRGLSRRFWPERVELVDRFPRTAAGKIRKPELRSALVDRAQRRREPDLRQPGSGPWGGTSMTEVELGDIVVNYRRRGSGPAVVLLHGLAEDHHSWDSVAPYLGSFTTYAVDLRGHGRTTAGRGAGTLSQLGDDLIMFLQAVTGPAAVVGYSLGGAIGLQAATTAPDLIRHLVVVATSSVVGRAAAGFFAARIAQLESGDLTGFAAGLRDDTALQIVTEADLDSLAASRVAAVGDGHGYVNAAMAMIGIRAVPLNPLLSRITAPLDIVGADRDVFCPRRASDIIADAVPHSRFHEIAGAGHLLSVDRPEAYGRLLARLLCEAETR